MPARWHGWAVVFAALAWTAGAEGLTPQEQAAAGKLNKVKCLKCHKEYHPSDYSAAEWDEWMVRMARKSRLKPPQAELLTKYFKLAQSAGKPPARTPDKTR